MSVPVLTESRDFDRVLEFTKSVVMEKIWDTVFDHSPLLATMLGRLQNSQFGPVAMNGRGKRTQTGGESIMQRHNLGENTSAKTLSGPWDTVTTDPSDTVRHSRENWRHYSSTITLSDHDILVNTGAEAISSLIEFETSNSVTSLGNLAAGHLYAASGATEINDLDDIVNTSSLNGLNPTVYSSYASRGLSARGTAVASVSFASGSFVAQGINDMTTCWLNASEGAIVPHGVYCDHATWQRYHGSLQPQERFTNNEIADAGFRQIAFMTAPVFADAKANSGSMYMLNFDSYKACVLRGADLSVGPFERGRDQEARTAKVMLKWNTGVGDRRFVNKMTGISD